LKQNKTIYLAENIIKKHHLRLNQKDQVFNHASYRNGWVPLMKVKSHYPFFIYQNYGFHPDLSKRLIPFLDVIDLDKEYHDEKIKDLQAIKESLLKHHVIEDISLDNYRLVQVDHSFVPANIQVDASLITLQTDHSDIKVYQTIDQTQQVYAVFECVVDKLDKGIKPSHIKILESTEDDDYQLKKLFKDAGIPLSNHKARSIQSYPVYKTLKDTLLNEGFDAFKEQIIDLKDKHPQVINAIIDFLNTHQEARLSKNPQIFLALLDKLNIKPKVLTNAVEILSIDQLNHLNDHILMMNVVDELFPRKDVDNDYLTNQQKALIGYPTSEDINQYRKSFYEHILSAMPHLTFFYPEKMVDKTRMSDLDIQRPMTYHKYHYQVKQVSYTPSNDFLRFASQKYVYEHDLQMAEDYPLLKETFESDFKPYSHQFSGIDDSDLHALLNKKYTLTGAKIEDYHLCPFKYLLKHLLSIDNILPSHYMYFGNVMHKALEHLMLDHTYDIESLVKNAKDFPEDILYKKELFDEILIENIKKTYELVKDFHDEGQYKKIVTEQTFSRKIKADDRFIINGIIDKIMVDEDKGYYAIVDYKYSKRLFSMKSFDQGLSLQLPFYLYLYDHETTHKPSGIFFRQTGLQREKANDDQDMRLIGVFLNDEDQMRRLDPQGKHILGLRYKKEGLYDYGRDLSAAGFAEMKKRMEDMIYLTAKKIEAGDFTIRPILSEQKNNHSISCLYCPFGHICYSKDRLMKEVEHNEIHKTPR